MAETKTDAIWKAAIGMAIFIAYILLCVFAFKTGISSAKTTPLELPVAMPYTAQAHYSVHATKIDGGIRFEPFCGEYVPDNRPAKTDDPVTHSDEAHDYQIVQMINSITDQTCDKESQ